MKKSKKSRLTTQTPAEFLSTVEAIFNEQLPQKQKQIIEKVLSFSGTHFQQSQRILIKWFNLHPQLFWSSNSQYTNSVSDQHNPDHPISSYSSIRVAFKLIPNCNNSVLNSILHKYRSIDIQQLLYFVSIFKEKLSRKDITHQCKIFLQIINKALKENQYESVKLIILLKNITSCFQYLIPLITIIFQEFSQLCLIVLNCQHSISLDYHQKQLEVDFHFYSFLYQGTFNKDRKYFQHILQLIMQYIKQKTLYKVCKSFFLFSSDYNIDSHLEQNHLNKIVEYIFIVIKYNNIFITIIQGLNQKFVDKFGIILYKFAYVFHKLISQNVLKRILIEMNNSYPQLMNELIATYSQQSNFVFFEQVHSLASNLQRLFYSLIFLIQKTLPKYPIISYLQSYLECPLIFRLNPFISGLFNYQSDSFLSTFVLDFSTHTSIGFDVISLLLPMAKNCIEHTRPSILHVYFKQLPPMHLIKVVGSLLRKHTPNTLLHYSCIQNKLLWSAVTGQLSANILIQYLLQMAKECELEPLINIFITALEQSNTDIIYAAFYLLSTTPSIIIINALFKYYLTLLKLPSKYSSFTLRCILTYFDTIYDLDMFSNHSLEQCIEVIHHFIRRQPQTNCLGLAAIRRLSEKSGSKIFHNWVHCKINVSPINRSYASLIYQIIHSFEESPTLLRYFPDVVRELVRILLEPFTATNEKQILNSKNIAILMVKSLIKLFKSNLQYIVIKHQNIFKKLFHNQIKYLLLQFVCNIKLSKYEKELNLSIRMHAAQIMLQKQEQTFKMIKEDQFWILIMLLSLDKNIQIRIMVIQYLIERHRGDNIMVLTILTIVSIYENHPPIKQTAILFIEQHIKESNSFVPCSILIYALRCLVSAQKYHLPICFFIQRFHSMWLRKKETEGIMFAFVQQLISYYCICPVPTTVQLGFILCHFQRHFEDYKIQDQVQQQKEDNRKYIFNRALIFMNKTIRVNNKKESIIKIKKQVYFEWNKCISLGLIQRNIF